MRTHALAFSVAVAAFAAAITPALAQTPPAASGTIARTADGRPDFSGSWIYRPIAAPRPADPRGICVGFNCGPRAAGPAAAAGGDGTTPPARPAANFPKYRPEFLARVQQLNTEQVRHDPALRCQNPGIPRIGPPDKLVQTPKELIMLYDDLNGAFWRIIPIDGRPHREDAEQNAFGDSIGRWDGDKLIIETTTFNEDTWLTDNGAFHTENMKVVEVLSVNGGSIDYQLTVHDPDVLLEPYVKTARMNVAPSNPQQPVPCVEMSIDKMVGIESYHPNARW